MKLKLGLLLVILVVINLNSVHAQYRANNLFNETIITNNQKSGQCSPDCCDDDCDK